MDINQLFESFKQKKVLIIGDVMVDAYFYGGVARISPEAPVPIVNLKNTEERLGGAANVALNVAAMGAKPIMVSVIGEDVAAKTIYRLLDKEKLPSEGIIQSENRITTMKTRVIGNQQHLLRIDNEITTPITKAEEQKLLNKIETLCEQGIDAIIFEDYNKGVLTQKVISTTIQIAKKHAIPTAVDPKKEHFLSYCGVTLFKPNFKELKEGLSLDFMFEKGEIFENAVGALQKQLQADIVFVTLSEHGVYIQSENEKHYVDAHFRNITDVSGAGDTVIGVAALCLSAQLSIEKIAKIANLAGGLVCEKVGVVSIDANKLLNEIKNND